MRPAGVIAVQYIAHRVNTIAALKQTPTNYGVELDLRDHGDRLVLQHDPFLGEQGEDFETYLQHYRHGLMILNIKSERIERRVLELVQRYDVPNYFFLDSSFPMIHTLAAAGERRIAVRFSEYEPLESALALAGRIDWVWVDCFSRLPLTAQSFAALKEHFKLCIVSPELHGRSVDTIADFAAQTAEFDVDAICTKRPDLWQAALGTAAVPHSTAGQLIRGQRRVAASVDTIKL
jgi:hypothetical protein